MKIINKLKEKQIKNQHIDLDLNIDNRPVSLRIMQRTIDYYMATVLDRNLSEHLNHVGEIFNKVEKLQSCKFNYEFFDNIIIEENLNMPLPEMKEKVDEYIKLLEENIISKDHISYPHDWTDNICKCLYKSDNLCPYAKECKGIPRKGCQYEKEMVMDLDCCLNQLKERGII